MKNKYFTLIELLVVIGIIAVLMTILLPALKKARETALTSVCLNNQKQLGAAVLMYTGDYDYYPIFYLADPNEVWTTMVTVNHDYCSPEVIVCPSFPPKQWDGSHDSLCYGINASRFGTYRKLSEIEKGGYSAYQKVPPAYAGIFMDSIKLTTSYGYPQSQWYTVQAYSSTALKFAHLRHGQKASCFFADGHVDKIGRNFEYWRAQAWNVAWYVNSADYGGGGL